MLFGPKLVIDFIGTEMQWKENKLILAQGYTLRFCFDDYKPREVIR